MKGGRCTMKKIQFTLLSLVCLIAAAMPAAAQQSVTITLKDNTTRTFTSIDSVRLVGGNFGDATGIGIKIYVTGATQSEDFLYSQMLDLVMSGQTITVAAPVFSPNGGEFLQATTVSISCATTGAIIYYTTDGSTPTATHGTRYTAPITVQESLTLRAVAVKDGVTSTITSATFSITIDNNVNANKAAELAACSVAWRMEFPHLSTGNYAYSVPTSTYNNQEIITYQIEWDCAKKSNHWTCYRFDANTPDNNVGRTQSRFSVDPNIPSQYQWTHDNYTYSNFSRGHMCMSDDRQYNTQSNTHTFYTTNIHPQHQTHNAGVWLCLEEWVNARGYDRTFCDTLYVVKAGTIDKEDQIRGYTDTDPLNGTVSGSCSSHILIPKYFYMCILVVKNNQYKAIGFWTEHTTDTQLGTITYSDYAKSIDEIEELTGLDFFCNLPDDIEAQVEASYNMDDWNQQTKNKRR